MKPTDINKETFKSVIETINSMHFIKEKHSNMEYYTRKKEGGCEHKFSDCVNYGVGEK
jgi:hypothetical protein